MFRVYSVFFLEKIWWASSEQEKTVSNSSGARTDQIRNIIPIHHPARNCGERPLPSINGTVNTPHKSQENNNNEKYEVQKICLCHVLSQDEPKTDHENHNFHPINNNNDKNKNRSVTQSNASPKRRTLHYRHQVSLNMGSKDILSPTITHRSTKKLSFSPRRILNRALSRTESSSPNDEGLFMENASTTKKRGWFTKKLKRAFSFHQ